MNLHAVEIPVAAEGRTRAGFVQVVVLPGIEKEQGGRQVVFLKINHDVPDGLDQQNLDKTGGLRLAG